MDSSDTRAELVAKFLAGRASPEERLAVQDLLVKFRSGYATDEEQDALLDKPQLMRLLELDALLELGLRSRAGADADTDTDTDTDTDIGRASPMRSAAVAAASQRSDAKWLPMAASVAGILLTGSLLANLYQAGTNRDIAARLAELRVAQPDVPLLTLSPLRGSDGGFEPAGTLVLGASPTVVVNVQLSFPDEPHYRVRVLKHPGREEVASLEKVTPKGAGDLVFALPRALLDPGAYYVEVSGAGADVLSIPFAVVAME